MSIDYEFVAPRAIHFGWGKRQWLRKSAASFGRRVFIVLGSKTFESSQRWPEIEQVIENTGVEQIFLTTISREPHVDDVDRCVTIMREHELHSDDWMLAIGGGSAIDLAKACGALATQSSHAPTMDYLEGVGRGLTIVEPPLRLIAMPTTGGTGAEATKNAVISSTDPPYKKSLRHEDMVPSVVIVDPELSVDVQPSTTAYSGMDAITQLIESYISRRAKPIPQALAVEGLRGALPALPEAVRDGHSRPAREAMAHAALLSGMALANSGLGFAHGVAAALGIHAGVAHGLACAMMLPVALCVNRQVSEHKLAILARVTSSATEKVSDAHAADAFVERITQLAHELGVPARLSDVGVTREMLPALVSGSRGNSMSGNPRELSDNELRDVLEAML